MFRNKLSWKLAFVVTLGIAVVHSAFGYFRVQREVALFESDMRRDHAAIAHALAVAATSTAARLDVPDAVRLIEDADSETDRASIQWLPARGGHSTGGTAWVPSVLPQSKIEGERRERSLVTLLVLPLASQSGTLEIRESLAAEDSYIAETVYRTATMTGVLILLCFAILAAAGYLLVQRPMRGLLEKVDRIGRGDFSGPVDVGQNDELATLAHALNMNCEQLDRLQKKNEEASQAKIAALEQLRHADRLSTVGKLAAGIAHELGTPLNVVLARSQMVAREESQGPEAVADALVIVEQTKRMAEIIRQLLGFARLRKPERVKEELATLCERSLKVLEPLAKKRMVDLSFTDESDGASAFLDAAQIEQVLTNLVMNAVQAQPKGGTVRVTVLDRVDSRQTPRSDAPSEFLTILVEDDGPGISEELRERIFEPFFTTKDVGRGTGLGLSVAYGIIREHNGFIRVEDCEKKGTRFVVALPRSTSESPTESTREIAE